MRMGHSDELGKSGSSLHIAFGCFPAGFLRVFFFFVAHSGRLNCMIIHLGALIYPLPVALNVGLFCEAALRISNEPTAQSVSLSEGAHLRPYSVQKGCGQMSVHMWNFHMGNCKDEEDNTFFFSFFANYALLSS